MSFFPDVEFPVRPPRVKSETPPWFAPPASELPIAVPIAAVLARREGVALCLRRIDVYRDGWRFAFSIRAARPESMSDDEWFDVLEQIQPHRPVRRHQISAELRLGIEFPDGSKIIGNDTGWPIDPNDSTRESPRLMLRHSGGGGSDDEYDLGMHGWLWPSPPRGSFRLVYDWPALNIPEQSFVFDATRLVAARENVLAIWPN